MAKTQPKPVEELTYEQAFAELEAVGSALESGEQALDASLALFERGQALTNHCASLLEQAELKVRKLTGDTLESFEEGE